MSGIVLDIVTTAQPPSNIILFDLGRAESTTASGIR